MVQSTIVENFLRESRQALGLEKKINLTSVSMGNALEITSQARADMYKKNLSQKDTSSTQIYVIPTMIFSGITFATYEYTGRSDISLFIAPIVGLIPAIAFFPQLNQNVDVINANLNSSEKILTYQDAMSILDADPKFEKEMLQRYKHYYY